MVINEIENRKTIKRINKTDWILEKFNRIDKGLARLTKEKKKEDANK